MNRQTDGWTERGRKEEGGMSEGGEGKITRREDGRGRVGRKGGKE